MDRAQVAVGSTTSACGTLPCPYCHLGLQHGVSKEQVLAWWSARNEQFIHNHEMQDTEVWTFLQQIVAVKFILSQMQQIDALTSSSAAVTVANPNNTVTYVGCSFVHGAASSGSGSQTPTGRTLSPEELHARATSPRAVGWYYKSGKKGNGDREIWLEESLFKQLEDAWKNGETDVKVPGKDYYWVYDLVNMMQTWHDNEGRSQSKPVYRKVGTGIMQ
jgi:hypothetical protein